MANLTRFYDVREYLFTSESVSEGHPDKVADQISDAILDEYLKQDPYSRVAVETLCTTNKVVLAGEVRAPQISKSRIEEVVRNVVKNIGYEQDGFNWQNLEIENLIHGQSADIARGVDAQGGATEGAGDQGLMFGYACRETEVLMPSAIYYSHKILQLIFDDIKSGKLKGLGPDAKSQVTVKYRGNDPVGVHSVVVSIQHHKDISLSQVKELIYPYIKKALPEEWKIPEGELYINPTGQFIIGGPDGDTGLTGRKIIVDTYGGYAPHGGGAFSGKDPTKVDRSAAYLARYIAKNVIVAGFANACTIQLAYAIGVAKPLSFYVNMHNTGNINEYKLQEIIEKSIDATPWGLRQHLKLHAPIYLPTATYGHFGRTPTKEGHFTWEATDLAEQFKKLA
ncbi:MAG: methionine adenosyltransferase [Rickettsiales bacterium]|nr:methionine adenosyltransferase [Rickettsiales bacterium]